MIETIQNSAEFEQNNHLETERKFVPLFPEQLANYRESATTIEQYYLSHPSEPFSLRLRETVDTTGNLIYSAALKDRGSIGPDGLSRLEVEVPITPELYAYYSSPSLPVLRKLRAQAYEEVAIDFYEDGDICIESESSRAWDSFVDTHGDYFLDVSGDAQANNEWRAHRTYRRENLGEEALLPGEELTAQTILAEIIAKYKEKGQATIHLAGRSGSGKSTIIHEVLDGLSSIGLNANVISTDDYHRGQTWLENKNGGEPWIDWDDPIVYDTQRMAEDLRMLRSGKPIPRQTIDFSIAEPVVEGTISPSNITIIEGLYAKSPDIIQPTSYIYELTTPLATCVGRRLLRDMRDRPEFADPAKSLRYILEFTEPRYREQSAISSET